MSTTAEGGDLSTRRTVRSLGSSSQSTRSTSISDGGLSQRLSYASFATTAPSMRSLPANKVVEAQDTESMMTTEDAIDLLIDKTVQLLRTASESLDLTMDTRDHFSRFIASEDRLSHDVDDTHAALDRSIKDNDRLVLEAERCRPGLPVSWMPPAVSTRARTGRSMSIASSSNHSQSTTPPSLLHTPTTQPSTIATPVEPSLWPVTGDSDDKDLDDSIAGSPTRSTPPAKRMVHHRRTSTLNFQSNATSFDAAKVHAAADVHQRDRSSVGPDSSALLRERLKTTLSSTDDPSKRQAGAKSSSGSSSSWWWR